MVSAQGIEQDTAPPRLPRKPEARTEKVEDLVERVLRGLVRVPTFQRGLKWDSSDVSALFDSIYRGYPIGSLLFYKRKAEARIVPVGPLDVEAPETEEAWWVVDGHQRVTSLTAALAHPLPLPARPSKADPYVLYFDAGNQKFETPPTSGKVPSTWVPLPLLLDASQLSEWLLGWEHRDNEELRRVVFDAGARLREYPIPLYLIEGQDQNVAKESFYRINLTGKPLLWTEVHNALFAEEGASPSTLDELSEELAKVGMGKLDEDRLLTCLTALRGEDSTRTFGEHHRRNRQFLQDAVQEGLPVLRRVLSFLRESAEIPHLRFLPKSILLDVLTRFFALHENPKARTRTLLARWFWRTVFGAGIYDERTLRPHGIKVISENEEESVQQLLALVRKESPQRMELPPTFDARADASRISMLALAHLGPRDLETGEKIHVAGLLEQEDKEAFVKIVRQSNVEGNRGPANRMIQAGKQPTVQRLVELAERSGGLAILESHAITAEAAEKLQANDLEGFLSSRTETLTLEVRRFVERVTAWQHSDRPSLDHILAEAGVDL